MKFIFSRKYQKAFIISLAGLLLNISAAWFGAAFITPNFTILSSLTGLVLLTGYIILGILCFGLSVILLRRTLR